MNTLRPLRSSPAAVMVVALLTTLHRNVDGVERTEVMESIAKYPEYYAQQLFNVIPPMQDKFKETIGEKGNSGGSQYLIAAALNAEPTKDDDDDKSKNLKFMLSRGDEVTEHCWKNMKLRYYKSKTKDCPTECVNAIKAIRTKAREIKADNKVHTELMMMYGVAGTKLMDAAVDKNQVVVLYSYYIPCSQLPIDSGYGECAGDLAEFLSCKANNPQKRQFFILVYKHIMAKTDEATNEALETNECISKLYMSMGGIPFFVANYDNDGKDTGYIYEPSDYVKYINQPYFQPFPRRTESRLQMVVDCLHQGDFLTELKVAPGQPDLSGIDAKKIGKYQRVEKLLILWYVLQKQTAETSRNEPKRAETSTVAFDRMFFGKVIQKLRGSKMEGAAKISEFCQKYMDCVPGIKNFPWDDKATPKPQDLNFEIDEASPGPSLKSFIEHMEGKQLFLDVQVYLLAADKEIGNSTSQEIRYLGKGDEMPELIRFTEAVASWAGLVHHKSDLELPTTE